MARRRGSWLLLLLLGLLPATFGGFTFTCIPEDDQSISDAFDDLIDAIEDEF